MLGVHLPGHKRRALTRVLTREQEQRRILQERARRLAAASSERDIKRESKRAQRALAAHQHTLDRARKLGGIRHPGGNEFGDFMYKRRQVEGVSHLVELMRPPKSPKSLFRKD